MNSTQKIFEETIKTSHKVITEEVSKSIAFNPVVPTGPMMKSLNNMNEATKQDYQKYGWLFGGR